MLNILNVDALKLGPLAFLGNLNDAMFWLYVAQAAVILIGILVFFVLLARTRKLRKSRREQVVAVDEEVIEEKKKVVEETAATSAEPQPQVIVVNPAPQPEPEKVKEEVERVLTGISLDVGVVQREFVAGEDFNCDGLLVRANYNVEPLTETLIAYSVVEADVFDRLSNISEIKVCYVLKPDLSEAGIKFVTVKYADQTAIYTVSVKEAPVVAEEPTPVVKEVAEEVIVVEEPVVVEKPEPVVETVTVVEEPELEVVEAAPERPRETIIVGEESVEAGKLRYDRSFTARYIQSDDEVKHWYTEIKNRLLSYKKVKARTSWKRETFKAAKEVVAKLAYRGKTLCLFLPLNPADYMDTKYLVEDESKIPSFADTPAMIRIKNDKHAKLALELIAISMQQKGIKDVPHVSEDFYVPYEGVVELINRGLIKREIKTATDEAIFVRDKVEEPEEVDNDTQTVTEITISAKSLNDAEEAAENPESETAASDDAADEATDGKRKKKKSKSKI